jgi:ABC-type transporter Mla subunit MlaD
MTRRGLETKVGLFMVIATVLAVAGVLVLGGRSLFSDRVAAYTILNENVVGLSVGSPVRMRGVEIGQVTRLSFAAVDALGAEVAASEPGRGLIRVDFQIVADQTGLTAAHIQQYLHNAVQRGLRARLAMAGITGGQYIEMEVTPHPSPELTLKWKPEGLYVPSESSTLDQMLNNFRSVLRKVESLKLEETVDRANAVLNRFDDMLRTDAPQLGDVLASLRSTLDNLDRLVASLRDDPARLLFARPPQPVIQGGSK